MTTILSRLSLPAFCLILAAMPAAANTAPDALVRATVEEVLVVLAQGGDRRALQGVVEQKVLPLFDFRAMTRLAMEHHWREATPEQQQALEQAFDGLLVRTHGMALGGKPWTVTNIAAGKVSPVISHRGCFAGEIGRAGIDGLIRVLGDGSRQGGPA